MWAAISFDVDNTLVDRDAAVRELLATRLSPSLLTAALEVDKAGQEPLFGWLSSRLPELGDPKAVARWFRAALPRFVKPVAAVTSVVREVASRHRTVAITNGGPGQRRKLRAAGLDDLFEHVVVSAEFRGRKPGGAIFREAARRVGVSLPSMLHVGDDAVADIAGASRAGMRTCWIARGRTYPATKPRPDHQIEDLADLLGVLAP